MNDVDQYIWDETDPAITSGRKSRRSKPADTVPEGSAPVARTTAGNVLRKKKAAEIGDEEPDDDTEDAIVEYREQDGSNGKETVEKKPMPGERAKSNARTGIKALLSYRWIMKNVSFFLFLAALAVIYIYNGHYADKIVRDINKTNKELKELQYEYKTLKSEVMFRSKQSELAKAVEPFGLKELTQPPVVLVDSTK